MPFTTLWWGDSTPAYQAPVVWSWRSSSQRWTKSTTASRGGELVAVAPPGPPGPAGAVRALPARGCRGLQSQMSLYRPGGPASGRPRRVRGPGLLQPLPRLVDGGEVVAVGLGAGGQPVAVGHEHPVAQLPLESRCHVALGGGHGAADGAVAFRDPQQVGDRVAVLQDGPGPRRQHFLVRAPGRLPRRREAHGTQLAEGTECHAGDEQQGIGFAGGGGEQPGITRAAGGVEEPERPLQAQRHLREDVAHRVARARGARRRSRGAHALNRCAAWAEVVHLPAWPSARREQQVARGRRHRTAHAVTHGAPPRPVLEAPHTEKRAYSPSSFRL